jgi:site-specific recombinase XerD
MDHYLDLFMNYLTVERGLARNTLEAYGRDLNRYLTWLQGAGVTSPESISAPLILRFMAACKDEGLAPRSRSRALVAIRTFHKFLVAERLCAQNPTGQVTAPRSMAALPKTLSPRDVETLLASPKGEGALAQRDRAMLEILYATGLRVSELVTLKLSEAAHRPAWRGSHWRVAQLPGNSAPALRQGRALRRAISQPLRGRVDTPGVLEDDQAPRSGGGNPSPHFPPHPAAFVCHTPAGKRC